MRRFAVVAVVLLAGCAHATVQVVTHAPQIAAWGAVIYGANQVVNLVSTTEKAAKSLATDVTGAKDGARP